MAVLAETHSGAIESAVAELSKRAAKHLRASLASLWPVLAERAPRAWKELAARAR